MKKTREEHAARFDDLAADYDDEKSPEYRACVSLVVEHAAPTAEDVVLDLGTGTGAIALALAPDAGEVVGRDISEGMMDRARAKARERGVENVSFGQGTFREPNVESADVVVSNFAMHHLSDDEKREAIEVIAGLGPRRFVLGDVMLFGALDPEEPFYSPEVDDPATVGMLADALTDAGFALTAVERVHEQVGVLVAERAIPEESPDERAVRGSGGTPESRAESEATREQRGAQPLGTSERGETTREQRDSGGPSEPRAEGKHE